MVVVRRCFWADIIVLLFTHALVFESYSAQQTVNDVVTESTFDFFELSEIRGYGGLAKTPEEKDVFNQVVKRTLEERVGIWESYAINGPLPAPLENAQTLYVELMTNVTARLCVREKGADAVKEVSVNTGFFTDRSIYVGPDDDGLLFIYTIVGNRMYTLLNPNGCQKRIYFRRSGAVLPDTAYRGRMAASQPKRDGDGDMDYRRQNGWYECVRFPPDIYGGRTFEKLFLILNSHSSEDGHKHYRAFPVYYKNGLFYLDDERWRYPAYMGRREGPFGFYSTSENEISFDMPPCGKGELAEIRLKGALAIHADEKRVLPLALEAVKQDERFNSMFTRWLEDGPDGRKQLFRKVSPVKMSAGAIRFISPFSNEETIDKDLAETYLKMINAETTTGDALRGIMGGRTSRARR